MIPLPVDIQPPGHTVSDLVAAIELVASGGARRVVLAGMPGIEAAAAEAVAHAQAAHVQFSLRRSPGVLIPAAVVGPLDA